MIQFYTELFINLKQNYGNYHRRVSAVEREAVGYRQVLTERQFAKTLKRFVSELLVLQCL